MVSAVLAREDVVERKPRVHILTHDVYHRILLQLSSQPDLDTTVARNNLIDLLLLLRYATYRESPLSKYANHVI